MKLFGFCVVLLGCVAGGQAEGVRISTNKLEALRFAQFVIGAKTYSNVVISSRTATDVFIRHQQGLANFKVEELSAEQLGQLGYDVEGRKGAAPVAKKSVAATAKTGATPSAGTQEVNARELDGAGLDRNEALKALGATIRSKFGGLHPGLAPKAQTAAAEGQETAPAPSLNVADILQALPKNVTVFLTAFLVALPILYFFFCYTAKLVCTKAGATPGFLIWVPLLSMVPLLRAAKLPVWLMVLFYVPVVNLVVSVVWCFKIVQARGKGGLTAFALIFPITSPFAWLYLAYSE